MIVAEYLKKWFWHEGSRWNTPEDCDFEDDGFGRAFQAMGLNPFPAKNDDNTPNPKGKFWNYDLHHNDYEAKVNDEHGVPKLVPVAEQKYKVKVKDEKGVETEKEYTGIKILRNVLTDMLTSLSDSRLLSNVRQQRRGW